MGSFSLSGGVEVFGFISPSNTTDQYPVIDPLYGIDGLRNVNTLSDLDLIPTLRRRAGMLVGVSGGTTYYKLKVGPWNNTISDWELFELGSNFTGGTVTGATIFTNGLTANTISATTYQNLPKDIFVTGGSYSNGVATFINNTGGTFNVIGFFTGNTDNFITGGTFNKNTETLTLTNVSGGTISISGFSDVFVTGVTYNNNTFTFTNNTGGTFSSTFNLVSGLTSSGTIQSNVISATTYQNLPKDIFVTGGTFSGGSIVFTNNSGGTFNVSGISSFDTFVTGFTYSNNTFTISQNSGSSLSTTINSVTGLTVGGTINSTTFSGGTYFGDGSNLTGIIRGSGGGRVFYFNLSNTQTPYYEFSPSATTQPEQSITTSAITSGSTSTIAGFLTPPNVPNVTQIVGGVWTFFVHSYKEDITSDFDIFCEVYKRTTGGTETFLFQTDPVPITSVSPTPSMEITDGYFSGTSLNTTDRLLVKVNVTNLGSTSKTATFVTEGNVHYSYSTSSLYIPSVDTFTTGFTYNNNTLTIQRNEGLSDLSVSINSVTGLTINGNLGVTGTTSSSTISATTYQNLPTDVFVTGGTFSGGSLTFRNNTGGTFSVSGISSFDTFVTGFSYNNNTFTIGQNSGSSLTATINLVTGLTVNGNLSVTGTTSCGTISATTYQNLPTDIRVTGASYSNNTFTFTNNTGGTFSTLFNTVTGLTVNGNLSVTGNTNVRGLTGTTALISGSGQNILTIVGSGSTQPLFTVQGSSGELFSITDSLTGSLFSVNDISGLPILEVFSDNTILMGNYLAPSLYTTTRVLLSAGTNTIYSIPTSAYTGAFFEYTLISSGATGARSGNIMSIWSGSTVNFTETQTTDIGTTTDVTFNMGIVGSNAVLSSSATTAGWTIKTIIKSI